MYGGLLGNIGKGLGDPYMNAASTSPIEFTGLRIVQGSGVNPLV